MFHSDKDILRIAQGVSLKKKKSCSNGEYFFDIYIYSQIGFYDLWKGSALIGSMNCCQINVYQ